MPPTLLSQIASASNVFPSRALNPPTANPKAVSSVVVAPAAAGCALNKRECNFIDRTWMRPYEKKGCGDLPQRNKILNVKS